MKAPVLGKLVRFALPLCLACCLYWAPLAPAAAGQAPAGQPPEPGLAAIDAQLRRGEWEPARLAALALIAEDLSSPEAAPLAGALARLALAEGGLGRQEDAVWHWHAAQNLDRSALSPEALAGYGAPGEILARHPLRRIDEAPAGLKVLHAEDSGVRSGRRIAGDIPPLSAAAASVPAPRVLRLQAVITTDGRLTEPVVLAGSAPGVTYEILENLRGWRYEPAQQRRRPVAVFRNLTVQLPGGAAGDGQIARVEGLVRSGRWGAARDGARSLWYQALEKPSVTRREVATLLMLRALAEAGLGMEAEAVCRWQAAQYVEPQLQSADLSAYGGAGRLLESNRRGAEGVFTGDKPARITRESKPEYPRAALQLPMKGEVVLGATIGPAGAVRQPLVVRVEAGGETVLIGLDAWLDPSSRPQASALIASTKLLAFSALDAVCDWRLDPEPAGETGLQRVVSVPFFSAATAHAGNPLAAGAPGGPVISPSAPDPGNLPSILPEGQNRIIPPS
jgi:hypothetical protein